MDILGLALSIFTGLLAGLLVNFSLDTLPFSRTKLTPHCIHCSQPMQWGRWFLFQKCAECSQTRSARTAWVFIFYLLSSIIMHFFPPGMLGYWIGMGLLAYFGLVFVMDLEHHVIVFPVTIFGAIIGLALGIYLWGWVSAIIGGLAGLGIMYLFYLFGRLFGRWMKKRRKIEMDEETLGFGDVTISGVIGFMLGWPQIIGGLILGILFGGLTSGLIILISVFRKKYNPSLAIAYAPFLVLGAMVFLYIPK